MRTLRVNVITKKKSMFPGLPTASLTVSDLFSSPFHFSVPHYQRPYSWTTTEAGQLLEDIFAAAGIGGSAEETEPDYFLGNILLLDGSGADLPRGREREPRYFDIVDGQQRLVTLAILTALLRDLEPEKWRWGARNRLDQLIGADPSAVKQKGVRFRIELRAREQDFLEHYVQERGASAHVPPFDPPGEPEERLLSVREHFRAELSALDDAERKRLISYLCEQCHFVVVLTRDIDRAHRLFTVLNERGRTLHRNDILKAGLLQSIAPDRAGEALAQWEHAAQLLGPSFETFFSHVFSIHGRGDAKIIAGIRRTVNDMGGPEPFLRDVVVPLAEAYHRVLHAADVDVSIDDEARRYLVYLGRLAEGDWAPAAILALREYADDPERGNMLIKEIDRLAHLLRLLCVGTNKRKRRFAEVVELIKSGAPIQPGEGPFKMSRDEVRNICYHLRTPYKRDQQVCKLLLLRLNDELTRSTTLLDPSDYSVEHVLPQRPGASSEWRRWFPDGEEREMCTESLGNLVVVTKKQNDRARNQEFARKREIYRGRFDDQPVLPITRDAVDADAWRAPEICAREAKLFQLLHKIWGIEGRGMQGARDVA
jgi:Protein of unknown function DUF262/Protein of unknown function (DUF1524)